MNLQNDLDEGRKLKYVGLIIKLFLIMQLSLGVLNPFRV